MHLHQVEDRVCSDPCAGPCAGCPDRIVCRCLRVTEATVVDAIQTLGLRTVRDIREATEAGDGCTCCHQEIWELIETHSPAEVCRVAS